ncbi:MAG: LTA synthase family protein, partial [Rhodospirillaceae bacterium]
MLKRAASSVRRLTIGSAFAFVIVTAALIYSVTYHDPYPALFAAPFFALGCGRGKHPFRLLALSLLPATVLVVVSFVKFTLLGVPLVIYDQYFLRSNVLMLAYNDWRVATGLLVLVGMAAFYLRHLLSGQGPFSRIERAALAAFGVAAVGCIAVLLSDPFVAIWEPQANTPTLRTFLKSAQVPKPSLHTDAAAPAWNAAPDTGFGAPQGPLPDIFLVLQESTFPPAMLHAGYEPQTLFANNAPLGGPLHVHTFAGGTWRTEFSVAIQMRPQEFGSDGLYVFHQLEGRIKRSIFTELKKLGYRTMVFYPVPGSFINAEAFYASIGVDEFYDQVS